MIDARFLTKSRTTLGRRTYNDILIDDIEVSGEHAVIQMKAGQFFIEDLKSTNGITLNGKLVQLECLCHNDIIGIGKHKIRYLLDDPPRHNTCRLHRTKNPGAAMKDRSWHDTDKHSRTGRLLGCCRLKARRWSWWRVRLVWEQEHYSAGAMMFSPCPPEGGHGLRRRGCRP